MNWRVVSNSAPSPPPDLLLPWPTPTPVTGMF